MSWKCLHPTSRTCFQSPGTETVSESTMKLLRKKATPLHWPGGARTRGTLGCEQGKGCRAASPAALWMRNPAEVWHFCRLAGTEGAQHHIQVDCEETLPSTSQARAQLIPPPRRPQKQASEPPVCLPISGQCDCSKLGGMGH